MVQWDKAASMKDLCSDTHSNWRGGKVIPKLVDILAK